MTGLSLLIALLLLSVTFGLRSPNFVRPATSRLPTVQYAFPAIFGMSGSALATKKKLCVITGTTSGLGKETAKVLVNSGDYFVVCACRDVEKMKSVAVKEQFAEDSYKVMELDLASFASVRKFVSRLNSFKSRPIDRLVCNAAVYQPAETKPRFTEDGFEEQLQINHLSHFLLCSLLLNDIKRAKGARMIIVGSITGNSNTIGGGLVLPLADLGDLRGLEMGGKAPISMIDGKEFNGAKAYKDSKVCNMMTINELHERYHSSTDITFSTMYPGCIATTNLFREKRVWFRTLFPLFMRYVTGGYVSEQEARQRLAQVVDAPECAKSGVYWSWNGGARQLPVKDFKTGAVMGTGGSGGAIFENIESKRVLDKQKSKKMWQYSTKITGAVWPSVGTSTFA